MRGDRSWLTLTEASGRLGVTPNTLRRWADKGQIPSFVTPGGHRRFLQSAIETYLPSRRPSRPALAAMGASSDHMARAYRRARPSASNQESRGWLAKISETERLRFRDLGMQLVGNLLAYLDAERERQVELLAAAEQRASEYGALAAGAGAALSESVEEFLRFRKPFVDELARLARRRHLDTREATDLLAQAESALDHVLIGLMLGHKGAASKA